jgi:hypothetical protein
MYVPINIYIISGSSTYHKIVHNDPFHLTLSPLTPRDLELGLVPASLWIHHRLHPHRRLR